MSFPSTLFLVVSSVVPMTASALVHTTDLSNPPVMVSAQSLGICASRGRERRSARLVRIGRPAICTPKQRGRSSDPVPSISPSRTVPSSGPGAPTKSVISRSFDLRSDVDIRSQHLLLGEVGPIIGAVNIFIEAEPLDIRSIAVNVNTVVPSVQALLIYDETRHLLGRATIDPSVQSERRYLLQLSSGTLMIEKRSDITIYVRPQLLSKDAGGTSNQLVEIGNIVVEGNGLWSSQKYTKASTETFSSFVTSRSVVTSIVNARGATAPLITGTHQEIGAFTFAGHVSDPSAHIDITDLIFELESTGGATVTGVTLRSNDISEEFPCIATVSSVTCSSIPNAYGALRDSPRTFTLYGNVSTTDPQHASLRLSLNQAGSTMFDGALRWNDGSTIFGWIGRESPLALGTLYKY